MTKDTRDQPELLFAELEEKAYQSELSLLDRYHAFSAEMLRIALVGLAASGFIFKETFVKIDWVQADCWLVASKRFAAVSVAMFGLAAAFALAQRYVSTEGVRFFFYSLRLHTVGDAAPSSALDSNQPSERDDWLRKRRRVLAWSVWLKGLAAVTLGLASMALAVTFVILLLVPWPLLKSASAGG
jgi:hypothetical protein